MVTKQIENFNKDFQELKKKYDKLVDKNKWEMKDWDTRKEFCECGAMTKEISIHDEDLIAYLQKKTGRIWEIAKSFFDSYTLKPPVIVGVKETKILFTLAYKYTFKKKKCSYVRGFYYM